MWPPGCWAIGPRHHDQALERPSWPGLARLQVQEPASPEASASAAQLCKRLKELVGRLDSVLPYLQLAIATVALLSQGTAGQPACCHAAALPPLSVTVLRAAGW